MFKIKYLCPLLVAMFVFTLFMPDEWYYVYAGEIIEIKGKPGSLKEETVEIEISGENVNVTHANNTDISNYYNVIVKYIEAGTGNVRVEEMNTYDSDWDYIESFDRRKMFKARYWLHPVIYGLLAFIFGMIGAMVAGTHNCEMCSSCPIFIFCCSKKKQHGFLVRMIMEIGRKYTAWSEKRKAKTKVRMKFKNDRY